MKIQPIIWLLNSPIASPIPMSIVTPRNPIVYRPKIFSRLIMAMLLADAELDVLLVHQVGIDRDLGHEDRERALGRHVVSEREPEDRVLVEPAAHRPEMR